MTGPGADPLVETLEARAVTVPTDAPEADGTAEWDATTMVLVLARHRDVIGLGWTYGPAACGTLARAVLAPLVVGKPLLDVGSRYLEMLRAVRNAGRPGIATYAISAVDLALWDLKARLIGLPLHRLLGAVRDAVPVYGSGGFTSYDDDRTADQLDGWTGLGIGDVKIKIGESAGSRPERDLHRMALAREVIGPETGLFVDANGGYTAKQAVRVMAEAEPLGIGWCEEPVSSDDLPGLRQVRDAVEPDVAAGEYGHDLGYFRAMCAAGAVDCLQADATRCGGVTGWLGAAVVAQAHQLELSGHCAPHAHLAAAAAAPNLRHLEWFHDHVRIERMLLDGTVEPDGGVLRPDPDAAGNGLSLREGVAEEYAVTC